MIRVQTFQADNISGDYVNYNYYASKWGLACIDRNVMKRILKEYHVRSDSEYIRTGTFVVDGDKDCDHLKCFGTMDDGSSCQILDGFGTKYELSFVPNNSASETPLIVSNFSEFRDIYRSKYFPTYAAVYTAPLCFVRVNNGNTSIPVYDCKNEALFATGQVFPNKGKGSNPDATSALAYASIGCGVSVSGGLGFVWCNFYPKTKKKESTSRFGFVGARFGKQVRRDLSADGSLYTTVYRGLTLDEAVDICRSLTRVGKRLLNEIKPAGTERYKITSADFNHLTVEKKRLQVIKAEANSFGNWCLSRLSTIPAKELSEKWGKLAYQCVGNISTTDANLLAYVKDLPEIGATLRAFQELVKNPKNPAAWASAWLSYRFADRLTISDTRELALSLQKEYISHAQMIQAGLQRLTSTTHSREEWTDATEGFSHYLACYTVEFSPADNGSELQKLIRIAQEWDFYPTLGNMWDLVPYSFVIDWFVDIGGIFDTIDRNIQAKYYNFSRVTKSVKQTRYLSNEELPEYSLLTARSGYACSYTRRTGRRLDSFCYQAEWGLPSATNIVDAASLILQKFS